MHIRRALLVTAISTSQVAAQAPTPTETTFDIYDGYDAACASVLRSLQPQMTDAPVPDMAISSLAASFALGSLYNTDDPCELPVVTGSEAEMFSEWASKWTEWESDHIPEYQEIWTACSDEPLIVDTIPVGPEVCPNLASKIKGGSGGGGGGSGEEEEEDEDGDGDNQEEEDDDDDDNDDDEEGEEEKKDDDSLGSQQTGSLFAAVVAAGMAIGGLY